MNDSGLRVMIAGGGTAGHINPGLAIAKEILKRRKATIVFVGTEKGLEKELIPKEGFELKLINVRGLKRKFSLDTFLFVKDLAFGHMQARNLIKEFKPDIVIGTGGYVCGPVLLNASIMGIPTAIHEQNAYPGMTNKILSRFVNAIMISFEESKEYFGTKKTYFTGNPLRPEIINANREDARKIIKCGRNKLIVAVGGSRGAEKINKTITNFIRDGVPEGVKLLFATGEKNFDKVKELLKDIKIDKNRVEIVSYIHNMHEVLAAADLLISRAGATTLSEITALGIPSVLIPSPNVTNNHQEYNARALEKEGAAAVILEKELDETYFKGYILNLIKDNKKLKEMSRKSKKLAKRDSVEKIYEVIENLLKIN